MSEYFETAMYQMTEEFTRSVRIHRDLTFPTSGLPSFANNRSRTLRIVQIQNFEQNVKHAAIIVEEVGPEFTEYPDLVERVMDEMAEAVFVGGQWALVEPEATRRFSGAIL